MASSASSEGKSSAFAFRPSKLSSLGEKIVKSWAEESSSKSANPAPISSIFGSGLLTKKEDGKKEEAPAPPTPKAYVFGSNIQARVEKEGSKEAESSKSETKDGFNQLAAKATEDGVSASSSTSAQLKESAAALTEQGSTKAKEPRPAAAPLTTGEEGETNLFHAQAKLHQFVKSDERYMERGSGQLRLNERSAEGKPETRLVMRVSGSGRLVLNSLIYGRMLVERLTPKRIRISATDPGSPAEAPEIALFLVTTSEADSVKLQAALEDAKSLAVDKDHPDPSPSTTPKKDEHKDGSLGSDRKRKPSSIEDEKKDGSAEELGPAKRATGDQ